MANELARHGVAVRIVDKAAARTDKSKALVLWSRTLELFDACRLRRAVPARPACRRMARRSRTARTVVARISLDCIDSRYPYALMIPQSETERMLEEQLASARRRGRAHGRAGRASPTRARRSRPMLQQGDGESETLDGRLADRLRRRPFDGAARAGLHLRGHDASRATGAWPTAISPGSSRTDRLHIFWHRDGILALFPITGGPLAGHRRSRPGHGRRPSCRSDAGRRSRR